MNKLISNIKGFDSTTLIESESHRKFLENFESDLLRGIGKISILKIIKSYGEDGVYGYQLLKDLKDKTNNMLLIKEGTLYPILRNLENWESKGNKLSIIESKMVMENERARKYYSITKEGEKILSHLEGFFSKLLEAISNLNEFQIILNNEKFIFCENCKNKIDYLDKDAQYCEICGFKLDIKL
jgi:PadR family transcriptional regulator PadR